MPSPLPDPSGSGQSEGRNLIMPAWYHSAWRTVWGSILVLGMCVGFVVLTLAGALGLVALGLLSAGLGSLAYHQWKSDPRRTQAQAVGAVTTHAVAGGVGVTAIVGVGAASGPVLALLTLLAAATSPWTVTWVGLRIRPDGRAVHGGQLTLVELGSGPESEEPQASELRALSDKEICRAWRASFAALQEASSVTARQRVVAMRHAYLDEFERRNPLGTSAWLASGPRASSSPDKYLLSRPGEGHRDAG